MLLVNFSLNWAGAEASQNKDGVLDTFLELVLYPQKLEQNSTKIAFLYMIYS